MSTPLKLTIHPLPETPPAAASANSFWSADAPTFQDMLDTINPLEHIPIISNIYHLLTGNTESTGSKIIGGALYGGPIGLVAALFDSIVKSATGSDIQGNIIAAVNGTPVPALNNGQDTQLALNDSPPDHYSANQRANYNAYVRVQNLLA